MQLVLHSRDAFSSLQGDYTMPWLVKQKEGPHQKVSAFVFYPIALRFLQILSKILYLSRSVRCSHLICLAALWRLVNPCTNMLRAPNLCLSLTIILFVNGISIFLQQKKINTLTASKDLESVFFTFFQAATLSVNFPFLLQVCSTSVMNNEVALGAFCQGSSSNHGKRNVTDVSASICTSVRIDTAGALYKLITVFLWGQYLFLFTVFNGNSWEYVQNFENLSLPFIFSWWARFSA